jgi:hypothetical protein
MDIVSETVSPRWAERTFGDAQLGDRRRVARLIRIAEGVAARPAGTIAAVFDNPAELCGAYDFVENDEIPADAIATGVFTPEQIDAVRDLQKDEVVPETGPVTLWQMIVAIAYLGGWLANKKRPPGMVPLRRGWQRVAEHLIAMRRRAERIAATRRNPRETT